LSEASHRKGVRSLVVAWSSEVVYLCCAEIACSLHPERGHLSGLLVFLHHLHNFLGLMMRTFFSDRIVSAITSLLEKTFSVVDLTSGMVCSISCACSRSVLR